MTSDTPPPPNDAHPSVSSGKDRSDGAASGHGRRKPWTAPHLMTVGPDDFTAAPPMKSVQDGTTCYNPV